MTDFLPVFAILQVGLPLESGNARCFHKLLSCETLMTARFRLPLKMYIWHAKWKDNDVTQPPLYSVFSVFSENEATPSAEESSRKLLTCIMCPAGVDWMSPLRSPLLSLPRQATRKARRLDPQSTCSTVLSCQSK